MKPHQSKVRIYYPFKTGGNPKDNKYWCALYPEGDVMNYHCRNELKKQAKEEGYDWEVVRQHMDGSVSVLEQGGLEE